MIKEFLYMAKLAKEGDRITILIKDQDGVRETLTFDFKESDDFRKFKKNHDRLSRSVL